MSNLKELLEFAQRIEENGLRFYEEAMRSAPSTEVRLLFEYLAEEEAAHQKTFVRLQADADLLSHAYPENLDNFAFLRAFVHHVIFSPELKVQASALRNTAEVIRFAMRRETESLLYYEEIKQLFSTPAHDVLDRIISEETQHYLKLSRLLEKLEATG
ncbi:MAG: ferritin family protein [candidate division FCPU426 bacterium]